MLMKKHTSGNGGAVVTPKGGGQEPPPPPKATTARQGRGFRRSSLLQKKAVGMLANKHHGEKSGDLSAGESVPTAPKMASLDGAPAQRDFYAPWEAQPSPSQTPQQPETKPGHYPQIDPATGQRYFINIETGESTWT